MIRVIALSLFVLTAAPGTPCFAQSETQSFPEFLMDKGENYRAMTEYLRQLHAGVADDDSVMVSRSMLGIFRALANGAEPAEAATWMYANRSYLTCDANSQAARDTLISFLIQTRRPGDAIVLLSGMDSSFECYRGPNRYLYAGSAYVQSQMFTRASREFALVPPDHLKYDRAQELSALALEGENLSRRSPGLAAALSIVPGLGYVYAGHVKTGIASLLVNGVLFGATYQAFKNDNDVLGVFMGVFAVSWYTSSIIGSGRAAIRYNERKQLEFEAQFTF